MKEIKTYYDDLAKEYDSNRFGNTYGSFIHEQELKVLGKYKYKIKGKTSFDLGCGTGRFMEFATIGVDVSEMMIKEAKKKYPKKEFLVARAESLPFRNASMQGALSFHLLMHLEKNLVERILKEVHRVLEPGGFFIFDIPSKARRDLLRQKRNGWHGSTSFGRTQLNNIIEGKWEVVRREGICLLPIHRMPSSLRKNLAWLDRLLCLSPIGKYSSYHIYILRRI